MIIDVIASIFVSWTFFNAMAFIIGLGEDGIDWDNAPLPNATKESWGFKFARYLVEPKSKPKEDWKD